MKSIKLFYILAALIFCSSCNNNHFEEFYGTWEPLPSIKKPIVTKIQIERINKYLVAAVKFQNAYQVQNDIYFYICEKGKDHLIIKPSQYYNESVLSSIVIVQPAKIYLDNENRYLYFSNAVFVPSSRNLFYLKDNKINLVP